MRILGFSKLWSKLDNDLSFTTFRYPRKDRDWEVEEVVKVVFKPRSKDRKELGIARIIRKDKKDTSKRWSYYPSFQKNTPDMIDPSEAEADGFTGMHGGGDVTKMLDFFRESYGYRFYQEPIMNKLTLYWIEKFK